MFYTPGLYGGGAGEWATATWAREAADFTGTTLIDVTVGAGGSSAADPDGDPTVVAIPGHTVTAAGGLVRGNTGSQMGEAAGSQLYNDMTYVGGGVQNTQGASGAIPGGGGASGEDFGGGPGGHGAHGAAWVVMRQT